MTPTLTPPYFANCSVQYTLAYGFLLWHHRSHPSFAITDQTNQGVCHFNQELTFLGGDAINLLFLGTRTHFEHWVDNITHQHIRSRFHRSTFHVFGHVQVERHVYIKRHDDLELCRIIHSIPISALAATPTILYQPRLEVS